MAARWSWTQLDANRARLAELVAVLNLRLARLARALEQPRAPITLAYGATVTPDAATGEHFIVTATDGNPFTFAKPKNAVAGRRLWLDLRNASGGALGAITWDAAYVRDTSFAAPAVGHGRLIGFYTPDGASWRQIAAATGDL